MNKLNTISIFLILLIISIFSFGQVAVGQWRDHLPYSYGETIAIADGDVYLRTNVGLLKYSTESGETEKMSKINGLSDTNVESIAFHKSLDYLVIGYSNGNIDLVSGSEILNIGDIKRKSMNADKAIYSIEFIGNMAYLGCGFGIVVLDLVNKEIRETWFIGENGTNLKVNDLDANGDDIYAATEFGIYKGNINETLVDFNNWEIITDAPTSASLSWISGQNYSDVFYFSNELIVNFENTDLAMADTLLIYNGSTWEYFDNSFNEATFIGGNDEKMILCSKYWIKVYGTNLTELNHIWQYDFGDETMVPRPNSAVIDDDGAYWIADKKAGLIYNPVSWKYQKIEVNGPSNYEVFDLDSYGATVYGVAGGMNLSWGPNWSRAEYFNFNNQLWSSYDYKNVVELGDVKDLVRVKIDPTDPSRVFYGSWVHGLVEMHNNEFYEQYIDLNSTLTKVPSTDYIRVGGMDFDSEGNLWVCNSLTAPQIHMLDKEGEWHDIDYSAQIGGINLGHIIVAQDDKKWVILPQGNGIFVFDDKGTPDQRSDDEYKKLSILNEDGEIVSNDVYSMAEDKDGYIWVGTNKGVVVYYNPEDVFESGTYTGRQVKIPRNDGTDNADILLGNEIVTSIKVDGANRKWFGTQTGGVYYTSEDGIEEIHHFTTENSPILDNNILCSTIVPETGEVFFGTTRGIISYRSTATEGSDDYNGVYVFPNPVEPDYSGPITISGLVAGSYVKITDISGNLVFEMRSEGGQAIWYGNNLNGDRVSTGVYLVFSSNETGSKTDITKILFIN